jgi:8-amino-7-oxononanoate synthase
VQDTTSPPTNQPADPLGWLDAELAALAARDQRRTLYPLDGPPGPEATIAGRRYLLLASNNYLGLADDPRVRAAAAAALDRYGASSAASRLISGTTRLHADLEAALAAWKGTEACVVFSSGYLANVGTIPALVGPDDAVFSDQLNHASIIDGVRLARARVVVYRHRDVEHLAALLAAHPARRRLIVTDSVFSMDGDLAPLPALCELAERHGAMLMVDEAHATGVLGPAGSGAVAHLGMQGRVPIVMGTLSKALGAMGGYVAGSARLVEYLRHRARGFVFDTALAPPAAGAALAAVGIAQREEWRRARLWALADRLRAALGAQGYQLLPGETPILPVLVGANRAALRLAAALRERGVWVPAIRPPTVPEGTARLRVTLMATHQDTHLEQAIAAFAAARAALAEEPA